MTGSGFLKRKLTPLPAILSWFVGFISTRAWCGIFLGIMRSNSNGSIPKLMAHSNVLIRRLHAKKQPNKLFISILIDSF